jgi:hypothetical protein
MSWKNILIIVAALALLAYFLPLPTQQPVALITQNVKQNLKPDTPISTPHKITVYQSQGQHGEVKFSDRPEDGHHVDTRVIDTRKGTTIHMAAASQTAQSAALNVNQVKARFYDQAQDLQQARIDRVIDGP